MLYAEVFSSYNSGAWNYPTGSGLLFGGSGLSGAGTDSWTALVALNSGGNPWAHEIKVVLSGVPSVSWQSVDVWLSANSAATNGYRLGFNTNGYTVNQVTGGSNYQLAAHGYGSLTIRAIRTPGGIRVVSGSSVTWTPLSSTTGAQGVGFTGFASGQYITQAQLAAGDTTAPNNVTGLTGQGAPGQVDLAWTGASDNSGGSGVLRYNVYRNGVLAGSTSNTTYVDSAVSPGTTYTYVVKTEDYHANEASGATVQVSTGIHVSGADPHMPRQTGVRPLGSYWGAAGENIDLRSGNLNFSLPLLKAQGRHGVSLGLGLSYNSQNWRRQSGVTHKIGYDVGYGFGWKLQAGSIFAVWSAPGVFSHYILTDGTGAEYRMDYNDGNGIWWNKEGLYIAYDPGAGRVRFMDGTFWDMGSTSALSEADGGTRYPTRVTDSNGNYISLEYSKRKSNPS